MGSKYLICYKKIDKMKFIGHLDLLRVTQRCIKRSHLPIAYSKGFNPHQIISFALPLSVGMNGLSEYMEIEMEEEIEPKEIVSCLNPVMPEGYSVIKARKMDEKEKSPAALVRAASFRVKLYDAAKIEEGVYDILKLEELIAEKRGKKGITEVDIRPLIYSIEAINENTVDILIAQGSHINLKPEILISCLYSKMDIDYIAYKTEYTRTNLYKENTEEGGFIDLYEENYN